MGDKAWKKRERNVAKYFNGERNALSGGNSKITRADVIHPRLFIECKLRKIHSVVKLWEDTNELAKKKVRRLWSHFVKVIEKVVGL